MVSTLTIYPWLKLQSIYNRLKIWRGQHHREKTSVFSRPRCRRPLQIRKEIMQSSQYEDRKNTFQRNAMYVLNYLTDRYTWLPGTMWNLWNTVPASARRGRQRRRCSASSQSTSGRKRSTRRRRSRWPRDDRKRSVPTASGRTAHAPLGWRHLARTWRWNVPMDSSLSCRRRRRRTLQTTRRQNCVWITSRTCH